MNLNIYFYLLGIMITFLGNELFKFVINFWVISQTHNTQIISEITAFSLFPLLFINLFSGYVVDRVNRKWILVISDLISGFTCIISYFYLKNSFNIFIISTLLIVLKVSDSFFSIGSRGIVPLMFYSEEIILVNRFYIIVRNITSIVAPLLGNLLIFYYAPSFIIFLNGISFIFSAILETFLKVRSTEGKQNNVNYRETIKLMINDNNVFNLLISVSIANFFLAGYPILLSYVLIVKLKSNYLYGLSLSLMAIAAVLSALFIKNNWVIRFFNSYEKILFMISLTFLFSFPNSFFILINVFLFSFFLNIFNIRFFSKIQSEIDEKILGQVFAIIFTIVGVFMPLGTLFISFFDVWFDGLSICFLGLFFLIALTLFSKGFKR